MHRYKSPKSVLICLMLFRILATSGAIAGWVLTCGSGQSRWLYSFAPQGDQATRSNQDRYRLVTVRTNGNFIVLSYWESRLQAPWPDSTTPFHYPDTVFTSPRSNLHASNNHGQIRTGTDLSLVRTHGNFIVLPCWDIKPSNRHHDPISCSGKLSWFWAN